MNVAFRLFRFLRADNAAETPSGGNDPQPENNGDEKIKISYSPRSYEDMNSVAQKVLKAWKQNLWLILLWYKLEDFEKLVSDFDTKVQAQLAEHGERPVTTYDINTLNKAILEGVNEVKIYISRKFGSKAATAQYRRYGIVHSNKSWIIPRDRAGRLEALPLMIQAIHTDGFDDELYGKNYWTNILTQLSSNDEAASETDGSISVGSAELRADMKLIAKVMTALRAVIRGNYPDSYRAVFRQWGWQREDY